MPGGEVSTKQDDLVQTPPAFQASQKRGVSFRVIALLAILLIIIGVLLYLQFFAAHEERSEPQVSVEMEIIEAEAEVEVLEEEERQIEINLSVYRVQVLNGTGLAGEADLVAGLLADEGFELIETGDADSFEYGDTEILRKESVSGEIVSIIEKSLETDYLVVKPRSRIEEDSEIDIMVVVGERR